MAHCCWLSPQINHLEEILAAIEFGGVEIIVAGNPDESGLLSTLLAGWKVGIDLHDFPGGSGVGDDAS